jgi:hypothetical protein
MADNRGGATTSMPDPQRIEPAPVSSGPPSPARDARIDQLLLLGLDHYFAGHYEQAIHVWSRVLLLDRPHPRARAYIARAQSAIAERQRQLEVLTQAGVGAARTPPLLQMTMPSGDDGIPQHQPPDCRDQLSDFETAHARADGQASGRVAISPPCSRAPIAMADFRTGAVAVSLAIAVAGGAMLGATARWDLWQTFTSGGARASMSVAEPDGSVPQSAAALGLARRLLERGRLDDSLRILNAISPGNRPSGEEAEKLRAAIIQAMRRKNRLPVSPGSADGSRRATPTR